jgi:hypothetical protein
MTFLLCLLCFVLGWRFAAFLEGYQSSSPHARPARRGIGLRSA